MYKQAISSKPLPNIYNKHTNWDQYSDFIRSNIDLNIRLKTSDDIELAIEKFNSIVHMAATISTPKKKNVETKQKEYPRSIIAKISERRNLRREWHRTRYPSDKTKLNRATKELKDMIKEHENDYVQSHLSKLTAYKDTNYSLWRATKNLKKPKDHIPPLRKQDGGWARTDEEKTTAFAEHLEKVFTPLPCSDPDKDDEIADYIQSPNQLSLPLKAVSPNEILREIKSLSPNKAPGYDLVNSVLLSKLPRSGIMFLVILFNSCLRLSHYPFQWKLAQVVMILKPGKQPEEVSSYRPISLLPLVGKLLEKVILNRMQPHLNTILPGHQFGFRQKHGTIEQVHRLIDTIGHTLENKKYCSAVFLDISQAFDRVWHDGLLFKIKKHLPHSFYFLLKSYLDKRCYEVKLNNTSSDLFKIRSGVPQGSILGPVLYLIYTADIPVDDQTLTATYADTAIMSVNANPEIASANLQKHITEIEKWLKIWRIKANQSKSVHVTFTLRKGDCPPIKLNGEQIPHDVATKYLGMHLDRRLTWQKHIWSKRKALDTKLRSMHWLIGKNSQLNNESKIAVYKTILKPVWTYGIELWGTASNSNIEIMERFQNKAIRSMFNIPKCIHNKYILHDLRLNSIKQVIAARSVKYQQKLTTHVNALAATLAGSGSTIYTRLRRNSVPNLIKRFAIE